MAHSVNRVAHIRDAAADVEFVAPGTAAVTATGQSAAKPLKKLDQAYWDNGELPWYEITVQIVAQALDSTTGDETYTFDVEVSADSAFTVPVSVAKQTITSVDGHVIVIDADTVKKRLPAAKYIRLKWTLAGTTPSATFYAFMTTC